MNIDCLSNLENKQVDVIVSTVPWTDSSIPLMAPAVLKPIVERVGMSCLAVDLNAEIYNATLTHPNKDHLINFFFSGVGHPDVNYWLKDMFESVAREMLNWQPKIVALSLFSYASRSACEWICHYIKKLSPDTMVIIGGAGCLEQFSGPSTFADDIIQRRLVDYHVRGDGEHALHQLLLGNTDYPGINSATWKILTNEELDQLPYPDYTNYNFAQYNKQMMGIQGSRGCVRTCTFCDYITNWEKFQWRTGESIFKEMKLQYDKFGIRSFKFQDALTNGNLKEFNKLIRLLAEYNQQNPSKSFNWGGYYIFRNRGADDEEMWDVMAQSGAEFLTVGIENLNEDIRYAMGKKFNNESITFHLDQARRCKIKLDLLFVVGYVNETQQHIDNAKSWLQQHVQYQDNLLITWGGTLGIFPNTWLDKNKDRSGVIMIGNLPNAWINPDVGSTPVLRAKWAKELTDHSLQLGYNVKPDSLDTHWVLEQMINTHE